jgi:hypothetical protein
VQWRIRGSLLLKLRICFDPSALHQTACEIHISAVGSWVFSARAQGGGGPFTCALMQFSLPKGPGGTGTGTTPPQQVARAVQERVAVPSLNTQGICGLNNWLSAALTRSMGQGIPATFDDQPRPALAPRPSSRYLRATPLVGDIAEPFLGAAVHRC